MKLAFRVLCWIVVWNAGSSLGYGQPAEGDESQVVVKVYRVSDLILPKPNYPFRSLFLPGAKSGSALAHPGVGDGGGGSVGGMSGGGMGGMSGGGGGGMGGGFGGGGAGGFFAVSDGPPLLAQRGGSSPSDTPPTDRSEAVGYRIAVDDLMDALTATIEPDSWDEVGGDGSMQYLGGLLVVNQTLAVHRQIASLLDALRAEGGGIKSVTIRVVWLILNAGDQVPQVQRAGSSHRVVDRQWLTANTGSESAQGQIQCLDGQTVHLIAGNFRSGIVGLIPVVGQSKAADATQVADQSRTEPAPHDVRVGQVPDTVMAQIAAGGMGGGIVDSLERPARVGYQPQVQNTNLGALLQITPVVVPQGKTMILDVQSIVTRARPGAHEAIEFENVTRLDRTDLVAQQFMTTVYIPVGEPVLIAGSTLEPLAPGDGEQQLYLILEATIETTSPSER